TILTMLGIIFGVAAVISMVSIGEGARLETIRQIELMGTNTVRLKAVTLEGTDKDRAKQLYMDGITLQDADYIVGLTDDVKYAVPLKEVDLKVRLGSNFPKSKVVGTTAVYPKLSNFQIESGRFLDGEDLQYARKVCVLGSNVAKTLFPLDNPLQ